jgi:hypothetical protein
MPIVNYGWLMEEAPDQVMPELVLPQIANHE